MTTITSTASDPLIRRVRLAIIAAYILSSVHHIYGGIIYEGSARLAVPFVMAIPLVITLGLLYLHKRTGSQAALNAFSILSILVWVIASGLLHAGYAHGYKDFLALMGVPASRVLEVYRPLLPHEFVYPPNNFAFEFTGLLEIVTAILVGLFTVQLFFGTQNDT